MSTDRPTDPTLRYAHGPLPVDAMREVERQLAKVDDLMTRYPRSNPTRYDVIQRFERDADGQCSYSVLRAPWQVTTWAWVAEGFAREFRAELAKPRQRHSSDTTDAYHAEVQRLRAL